MPSVMQLTVITLIDSFAFRRFIYGEKLAECPALAATMSWA
jgi:hypothetical protein